MAVETSLALQQLHQLLEQLGDGQQLLVHGPRRIAAAQKKTRLAEQATADQKEHVRTLRKAADEKTLNLKSLEAEIDKLEVQLNEARVNREYDIIQAQIESKKAANSRLEDEILSLLTQVDEAAESLQRLQAKAQDLSERTAEMENEVSRSEAGIREDIQRLESEVTEAERAIPSGDARAVYQRLRNSIGSGTLSEVQDSFCLACNTSVTAQDCVQIKVGEFVTCRECGRILYIT